MIPNEPVVAAIGVVITVLTVLSIGVVNELVVAVVAVEAVGVVLVVDTDIVTEDSDAVLNVVGIILLSAKHTTIDRQLILVGAYLICISEQHCTEYGR